MTTTGSGFRATSAGNGTTASFPVPFSFEHNDHLIVALLVAADDDTDAAPPLVLGTDYTVSGSGEAGTASVDLLIAPPAGSFVRRERRTPRAQALALLAGVPVPNKGLQKSLDRLAMCLEEVEGIARIPGPPGPDTADALALLADGEGSDNIGFAQAGAGAARRSVRDKLRDSIHAKDFGAKGDGVTDDGDALNAMFAYVRTLIALQPFTAISVTGCNGRFRTSKSIDVTGMAAWSLTVRDMLVLGECTGKAVFDLIGTRGYVFENVSVVGSKTNRPAVAFQAQRGNPNGFCDNASFRDCNIDGYFSRACVHDYGQETTVWAHCTLYNRDHTGRVAIHSGYSSAPMTSDYSTVMTGGTSCINKQFLNCDYRYLPADEDIVSITGITSAAAAVVTAPGHSFTIGEKVVFQYVAGMPLLASKIGTVTAVTASTFTVDVNTTGLGTFGGSGNAIRAATKSPLYVARLEGVAFKDCYVVSYGQPPIEVDFPDAGFARMEQLEFSKLLCEGAGHKATVAFRPSSNATVQGFTLTQFNSHTFGSMLTNLAPPSAVHLYGATIENIDPLFGAVPLVDNASTFATSGATIIYDTLPLVAPESWAVFNGQVTSIGTGKNTLIVTDELRLNGGRIRMPGTFTTGTSSATLGAAKPGAAGAPATWESVLVDGQQYWRPLWAN